MNEDEKKLFASLGNNIGELSVALRMIIHALKKQPSIDGVKLCNDLKQAAHSVDNESIKSLIIAIVSTEDADEIDPLGPSSGK